MQWIKECTGFPTATAESPLLNEANPGRTPKIELSAEAVFFCVVNKQKKYLWPDANNSKIYVDLQKY